MDMQTLRIPPHSLDAEQAVLGGLMISEPAWWEIADVITVADFYHHDHRLIFAAIADLRRSRKPCDAITLAELFQSRGTENGIDMAYLIDLANTTPSAANVRAYADIVAEKSKLRQMIDVGTQLAGDGFAANGRSALDLIGEAQTRIGNLLASEPCELELVQPVMQRVWERLSNRHLDGGGIHGLTMGLPELDELLGGLRPGQLGLIAARPKMGKTTLAQNVAEHVALTLGKAVAIFSFEMSPEELGDRMLSSMGGIAASRVRSGGLTEDDWASATNTMTRLRAAQIYIARPRRARVDHVIAQLRRQHARTPLALAIVDYLQLMDAPGDNRAQAIGDITRSLKIAAGELGIPILLLSQLNRKLEERTDKRPVPADLRDSGSIEQDADFVLFIYRDEIYNPTSRYKGTAELIVALQRNGPPGDVRVLYQPDHFRFLPLPPYWEPEGMPESETPKRSGFGKRKPTNFDSRAASAGE